MKDFIVTFLIVFVLCISIDLIFKSSINWMLDGIISIIPSLLTFLPSIESDGTDENSSF